MDEKIERLSVRIYPDALLSHCFHSGESAEVTGARLILCCIALEQDFTRTLPDDDRRISKWLGISIRHWQKIKGQVVANWAISSGGDHWILPEPDDAVAPRGGIV